ncbi:MAG: hypothetical protein ACYC27_20055 [Armatimonadota bacterium]
MLRKAWRWFISQPEPDAKGIEVYVWWEQRRIPYNIIVGLGGIVSLVLFFLFIIMSGHLEPGEDAVEPLALIMSAIVGPPIINLCYTAGWVADILSRAVFKRHRSASLALFIAGTLFSLLIIGLPAEYWGYVVLTSR